MNRRGFFGRLLQGAAAVAVAPAAKAIAEAMPEPVEVPAVVPKDDHAQPLKAFADDFWANHQAVGHSHSSGFLYGTYYQTDSASSLYALPDTGCLMTLASTSVVLINNVTVTDRSDIVWFDYGVSSGGE